MSLRLLLDYFALNCLKANELCLGGERQPGQAKHQGNQGKKPKPHTGSIGIAAKRLESMYDDLSMKLCSILTCFPVVIAAASGASFGVTPAGAPMPAEIGPKNPGVVVIGGLDGTEASVEAARKAARGKGATALLHRFANPAASFPPTGEAYAGQGGEAHYLWRFLLQRAPDVVIIVRSEGASGGTASSSLIAALQGKIPAEAVDEGKELAAALKKKREASPWRKEIEARLARPPMEVARQLAVHYGHALDEAVYIPAMAVVGRLRLDQAGTLADAERIVAPYATGAKPSLGPKPSASHQSGHLLFGELFKITKKPAYLDLVKAAAGMAFDEAGKPRESMPLHNEMSDSFFMGCPILAQAGRLTGEERYYDMALRHFRFMQKLDLRADGIYRHSPLDEGAWGRGNGFPALGLALTLTELPENHPVRPEFLAAFQSHLRALLRHQDDLGAWHQVIDRPESYPEYTATAMIGFALTCGLRHGWIKGAAFEVARDQAWKAISRRTAPDGVLLDVCASTGKQKSLREYYDRPAIFARDPRGGAMGLLFSTELMAR